jgi:hypothetical protein
MRNRTRVIAAAAAVTAALAAGSTAAALASTTGAKPGPDANTVSATGKPAPSEKQGHDAIVAAVAKELDVSTARVSTALRPLFAAGSADPSSPQFLAAARSLGVSAQQLAAALASAKQSLAGDTGASPGKP